MDWRAKVELFEEIRREYEFGIGTIAGVAKKLRVHRRMVREAIGSALPVPRKKTERPRWKLAGAVAFVDGILESDRKAPRKQRHTAHRIWERIRAVLPECVICERTVRQYVQERKTALGLVVNEVFVPQSYDWGVEAQVDWYEAVADLAGERTKLQVFSMRSMASGAAFHCAFLHATQQAFLEAHELAFAFFCGVSAGKRRHGSSHFGRTGASTASSAHRRKDMKRVAWKEKPATSAEITGCRCRRLSIWRS